MCSQKLCSWLQAYYSRVKCQKTLKFCYQFNFNFCHSIFKLDELCLMLNELKEIFTVFHFLKRKSLKFLLSVSGFISLELVCIFQIGC